MIRGASDSNIASEEREMVLYIYAANTVSTSDSDIASEGGDSDRRRV